MDEALAAKILPLWHPPDHLHIDIVDHDLKQSMMPPPGVGVS
jgi:hypothetical protein